MQSAITIHRNGNTQAFVGELHFSETPGELQLDPETFYKRLGKVPEGPNWEIEIITPDDIMDKKGVNFHRSKDGKPFMCYPAPLPTAKEAEAMFKIWSAGTVLFMESGIPLNNSYKGDAEAFFKMLEEEHGITVES